MPNTTHEITAEFFRNRPELATELLGTHLGYQLPEFDRAEVISAEFNNIALLSALVAGLAKVEPDRARLYYDFVASDLHGLARTILEAHMTIANYEYRSDFARGYYEDGLARGEVEALLTVLGARGFDVSDDVRARIDACTDPGQLNAWIRRAVTIDKVEELFD